MMDLRKLVNEMSVEDLCGQVLCYDIQPEDTVEETYDVIKRIRPGSLFLCGAQKETLAQLEEQFQKDKGYQKHATEVTGVPCIMATDIENGPGCMYRPLPVLPSPMSWASCNDEKMIERAGELTGRICRKNGIHYSFGPVVDLNINFRNPLTASRSISDDADRIIRIAGAYARGMQKNGYMAATAKHFPGDGVDERNQHFMTTVNDLFKEEWMATYGKVYKEMFKQGVASVMVGHISCPAFQPDEIDEYGALPGTLSKQLITDLLKGELGFEGCVISDAMSMIGACSRVPDEKLGISFFKAGGDMMLFPEAEEFDRLVNAVKSGELSIERMRDAAYRVLKLKEKVRLFEDTDIEAEIGDISADIEELYALAQQIANQGVKLVRNNVGVVPVKKQGGKVLILKVGGTFFHTGLDNSYYEYMEDEFQKHGWEVTSLFQGKHRKIKAMMNDYDLVVVACVGNIHGQTLRVGWDNIMAFWRGYVLQHPNIVFVGLDDPYKLYDFPYAKTYINTFGETEPCQRAAVKLILGDIESQGKNPVSFREFFQRED
ncbi:MAG: glycoside hydrolase family 3 protein [Clostridia bacterium]|nr:glycoside hydrolase family 3 protein [Clostridia bacterium]